MVLAPFNLLTADERLALIKVKIERAKKHIIDLQVELVTFFRSNPYDIVPKNDVQSGEVRHYLARMEHIPLIITAITGDVIQNLRSALDHLAYQLLLVHRGVPGTDENIGFIVRNCPKEYKAALSRPVKRMRQDAIDSLLSVEAYKGGKGHQIWVLNRLNNIDKHRLILAVASASGSAITSTLDIGRQTEKMLGLPAGSFPVVESAIYPADPQILKVGDEMSIANVDPQKDGKFHIYISFNEPQIPESGPLLETLQHFADLVSNTVLLFKPCLV